VDARKLLKEWDLRPSKGLGQNFIVDQAALAKIAAAAALSGDDTVLEIGPGLGALTERLAAEAGRVVAVEVDGRLLPVLRSTLSHCPNVTLVEGDVLALEPADLVQPATRYQVVANLPYYITSAILRHLLEARLPPRSMVLTVQREVAERITAQPGQMSLLAVSVQLYGTPKLLFRIKPGSFYPVPDVTSAVVRVDLHAAPPVPAGNRDAFFRVVRAGFSQRRKQLRNTLAAGLGLPPQHVEDRLSEIGLDARRRAQTLSLIEWAAVTDALGGARAHSKQ